MTLDARASIETCHADAAAIPESPFSGEYVDCDHKTSAQKGKFKVVRVRSKYVSKYCYALKKHSHERLVTRRKLGKQSGESKSERYLENSTNSNSAKRCSTSIIAAPSKGIDSHKYNTNIQKTISSLDTIATDDFPEVSITPSKCIAIESSAMSRTTSSSSNESCDFCTFNKSTIEIGTIIKKIIPTEFHLHCPNGSILPEDKDYVFRSSHYTSGKPGPTMYLKMRCWIVVARYDKHMACVPITSFGNGVMSSMPKSIAIEYKGDGTDSKVKVASGCKSCSLCPKQGSYVMVCRTVNVEYKSKYRIVARLDHESTKELVESKKGLDALAMKY